ncbi:sulfite exporter TauE/SafE family protein [Desulfovibrio sp.]|uniref:sulfite exporter TauE/SafE family protein n=1 Tax=Desulfovibrio sp. TaxID=885 RepID=UPI0023D3EF65|nr:sulfite exporter TauE/SafE family protein [Desulfovibrio sp.]MDE7242165.1 sulfite exporter TauE/SafE family protein [Desulfovibrio sp.]
MDILILLYESIIWFLAGLLTGLTSFGGNLFAIPLLGLAIPMQDAILLGCLCGTVMILALAALYYRWARWGEIVCLGLASVPGVLLGVAFLQHAGPRLLMLAAGGSLVLFLLWQYISGRLHVAEEPVSRWWSVPLGFASGVMMGAVGMGGPPFVLYAYLRHWSKESTIGGGSLTAIITMLAVLPAQWEAGLYTVPVLKAAIVGAVFSVCGILASLPLVHRINARLFRRLLLLMIGASALILLMRGLLA